MSVAARPFRDRLAAVGGAVWDVSFGALRDFVWADLRNGMIDLRGLPTSTRALIWLSAGVLVVMLGVLLMGDSWRAQSPLVALPRGVPGRGALVPTVLVPATLLLFAISWALILTGAVHAAAGIRIAVLLVYLLTVASWAELPALREWPGPSTAPDVWLGMAAMVGIPLIFVALRRARERPALEFVILLLLVGAALAPAQARSVDHWRVTGVPLLMARLENDLSSLELLILPLLLLAGIEVAGFVRQTAEWSVEVIAARLPDWAPGVILVPLLAWRLHGVGLDALARLEEAGLGPTLFGYVGALLGVLGVGLAWWAVVRLARTAADDAPLAGDAIVRAAEHRAFPLVIAYTALQLVAFAASSLGGAFASLGFFEPVNRLLGVAGLANSLSTPWLLFVDCAALALGGWLARRGRPAPALYLASFSMLRLWWEATRPGRPLAVLDPTGWETVDAWWVLVAAVVAITWQVRGRLTRERALGLIFVLLIMTLLPQTEFIESKFGPLLGWAGVGFIAFGIAWDALTKGAWANRGSTTLPRTARILMYLGYALLSVTVINWVVASHDLFSIRLLTGGGAMLGFTAFGRPMLYAVIVATLCLPARMPGAAAR